MYWFTLPFNNFSIIFPLVGNITYHLLFSNIVPWDLRFSLWWGFTLKMEAARSSETLVSYCNTMWCNNTEDINLNCNNLFIKSHATLSEIFSLYFIKYSLYQKMCQIKPVSFNGIYILSCTYFLYDTLFLRKSVKYVLWIHLPSLSMDLTCFIFFMCYLIFCWKRSRRTAGDGMYFSPFSDMLKFVIWLTGQH
jgi:hypothetical protein